MLFDLRGRGRRRTVQAIYLTLAVLMGGGLVFFGIGGDVSGGLFDAFSERGGGAGGSDQIAKRVETLEKRVRVAPRDTRAWAELARSRYQLAGQGDNYDQDTGAFTPAGQRVLGRATEAWERHLALRPDPPDANVAALMVQAYGPAGLRRFDQGVIAAEIISEARPSAATFAQLAIFAYAAKQARKADLAAARAVELAPQAQRAQVKSQLDQAKSQGGFGDPNAPAGPPQGGTPQGGEAPQQPQPKPNPPGQGAPPPSG